MIATIFKDETIIDVSYNIRSKEPAIANMIMKKIKQIDMDQALEAEMQTIE